MLVRITYEIVREIVDDEYQVSVTVLSTEGITPKIFVHNSEGTFLYVATTKDIETIPEDAPAVPDGNYRLSTAVFILEDPSSATTEIETLKSRVDSLAEAYQEQGGSFEGSEEVTVEYGTP